MGDVAWYLRHPLLKSIYKKQKKLRKSIRGRLEPPRPNPIGEPVTTTLRDDRYEYHFVCHSEKERERAQRLFEKEKGTITWLDRELRPNDVFFDIGANIGMYTIFGARRVGSEGVVVAFEPHVRNASSLVENLVRNKLQRRVLLVTAALFNREQVDRFNYQSINIASSASQFGRTSGEDGVFEPALVEIKYGCDLDHLCGSGLLPLPDVIKLDVDGLEFEILQGMRTLLSGARPPRSIQVELGAGSIDKVMTLMSDAGYDLREKHLSQSGLQFVAAGNNAEEYYPQNGVFYHRSSPP